MHDTKDCHVIAYNKAKKSKDSAKSAENSSLISSSAEQAMMAAISHIKSPAVCCSHHFRRPKPTANDPWNPDTGASSTMTYILQWMCNTVDIWIPVELANNEIVHATKRGQVWFQPVVNGRTMHTIIFDNVLYIPDLQNNLFSVLSVVRHSGMRVVIEGEKMLFYSKQRDLLMSASIEGTTGRLDGYTLDNTVESAFLSKWVPRELLHQ